MTTIVGAVDASTVQIEGVVSITSTRFDASATDGTTTATGVFTVPMVGQWNVGGDQVLSLLAQFVGISPYFGVPSTDVDIAAGAMIAGPVGVADIPNDWTHLPPAQPPESYIGFNLSVGIVEQVVGLGQPFWGRLIYTWDSEWTATVHIFYRDGFPADSTSDVDVVIVADGIAYNATIPGTPIGVTGAPESIPFPLRAMPPTAGQQIITGDTNVTGIEGTIVNNGPNGTAITAVLPRPAPGTELVVVSGANDGVFAADGDDIVVAATGATASTYALPARSVVTLGFLEGAWTVLDDTSTGGGGVALGETSSTAYRGDRGKTAYDHSQVVTGNPHGTTAADVGADPAGTAAGLLADLLDGAPAALDTLNELAAAINDDASFAATITTALAGKASSSHNHAASAIASGTIDIARIPTGTTGSTVPFGNDARFTDARTPTDGSVTTAKLDATLTAALARIPTTVVLAADRASDTSATIANTTDLSFPVTSGTTYIIRGMLDVTGASAGDLRVSLTCPSGTVRLAVWGKNYATSATGAEIAYIATIVASGGIATDMATVTGQSSLVLFEGYFTASASGTFQMQHGQRSANATATTVKAGSYLTYHT